MLAQGSSTCCPRTPIQGPPGSWGVIHPEHSRGWLWLSLIHSVLENSRAKGHLSCQASE